MSKITFWAMVVIASVLGIYGLKMAATKSNVPGFQKFMEVI